jgi:hypothetical protein
MKKLTSQSIKSLMIALVLGSSLPALASESSIEFETLRARWECTSQDLRGTTYSRDGWDPNRLRRDVHDYCVYRSNGPCRDLGCRRF